MESNSYKLIIETRLNNKTDTKIIYFDTMTDANNYLHDIRLFQRMNSIENLHRFLQNSMNIGRLKYFNETFFLMNFFVAYSVAQSYYHKLFNHLIHENEFMEIENIRIE